MARIRSKDTTPEITVRKAVHRLGLRFRLHRNDLAGTPDLVFPKTKTAVFVHGCFWHRHPGCRRASTPETRAESWLDKFERNIARDRRAAEALASQGWRVLVVWECETKNAEALEQMLRDWFELCESGPETARQAPKIAQ